MPKSSHRYFLRINGRVIKFDKLYGFPDMEDFMTLCVFTGLFNDCDELARIIWKLGLIDLNFEKDDIDIEIVKSHKDQRYSLVTENIIYKSAAKYLSEGSVRDFFYKNKGNHIMITEILEDYRVDTAKLISIFEVKVRSLQEDLAITTGTVKKDIETELERRNNSLSNFYRAHTNIMEMISLVNAIGKPEYKFERDLELEYINRLEEFAISEASYIRGRKRTPNNRGVAKLAFNIDEMYKTYPDLEPCIHTHKHDVLKTKLLSEIKNSIMHPLDIGDAKKPIRQIIDDGDIDPDDFMFLEVEDFERIPNEHSSQEELDSIEDSIGQLEEKQRAFGK